MIFTVTTSAWAVSGEEWTQVHLELVYNTDEPCAVTLNFTQSATGWMVGRDLVKAGLHHPTGAGDVRVWPSRASSNALFLHLTSPAGEALLELDKSAVQAFLEQTAVLRPYGGETIANLDQELRQLLGGQP